MIPTLLSSAANVNDAFNTGMTGLSGDITGYILAVIPVGFGLFALKWGVLKGMDFFKKLFNK